MTFDVFNSAYPATDFGPDAYGSFGEAWRWRIAGYAIISASAAFACGLYWQVGQLLLSLA
ncbi:hypothetical protein HFN89_00280 [Rhizobium laguerreae]|nr:hypothetical protein [Rhizobium laguerreae]